MKGNRTTNPRRRLSAMGLADIYLTEVIDWAAQVGTPTADRHAMKSADLQMKASDTTAPGAGLADSMGAPWQTSGQTTSDTVAVDVLRRSLDALEAQGADIDAQTIGVGLDAADRVIKAHARDGQSSPSMALIGSGFFTDDVDGREHDHMLAGPPWDCCRTLRGQRPTEWRLHAARYGDDAPMTTDELDTLKADYAAEQAARTPRAIVQRITGQASR